MIASRMTIHKITSEMVTLRLPYEEMASFKFNYFI